MPAKGHVPDKDWWESDPFAVGGGLGLVLHQKQGDRWRVANVLRKSPAERAGIRIGDHLASVDDWSLSTPDADVVELLGMLRSGRRVDHRLTVERAGEMVEARLVSKSMRVLFRLAAGAGQVIDGGLGGGGGCSNCRTCAPRLIGWMDCGTGRPCQDRCLIA